MKEIRLASKIIRILTKDRLYYPGRLIADMVIIVARCGVLLSLYWYVFKLKGGVINNIPYNIAAWSMFFYFAFSVLQLRYISRAIMTDVQTGAVELLFSKPVSYVWYRAWWQFGSGFCSFAFMVVFGGLLLALVVGIPSTMGAAIFLPTFILAFIGASLLSLVLYSIIGILSFWIEDINPIFWLVDKAVMILGGSYLPVALFPESMYKMALYSPFGASQFVTHAAYESWSENWLFLVGIQIFWIIALGAVAYALYAKARTKVFVNGG